MKKTLRGIILFSWLVPVAAIAQPFGHYTKPTVYPYDKNDPYQCFNRSVFVFNDTLDNHILKPVAKAYNYAIPKPGRQAVTNFFQNLSEVPVIINDLLQGNCQHLVADTWRLVLNSTVGIAGLCDIAGQIGIPYHANDFGITMAKWGYRSSAYLILPILGPSTVRDGFAIPIEYYGMSVYPWLIHPWWKRAALLSLNGLNMRANALNYSAIIDVAALDPYTFQRDAYIQHRNYEIDQALSATSTTNTENDSGMVQDEPTEPVSPAAP